MEEWSTADVSLWLESLGMGEYAPRFREDEIDGSVLRTLGQDDLVSLGVTKIGHKKKLLGKIYPESGLDSSTTQSSSRMDSSLSMSASERGLVQDIVLKVSYRDTMLRFKITSDTRLAEVRADIGSRLKTTSFTIKYRDSDGDKITIARESDWIDCIGDRPPKALRLYVSRTRSSHSSKKKKTKRSRREKVTATDSAAFTAYGALMTPIIVIDEKGIIQFMNNAAKSFSGYNDLAGQNVKMLMPNEQAVKHDQYLATYKKTGKAKIIGTGRQVLMVTSTGDYKAVFLEVTETTVNGTKYYVGSMGAAKKRAHTKSMLGVIRDVLESLSNPAVAINEDGTIQVFNKAAAELFGYDLMEVVGQNVKMLMPDDQAVRHQSYIQNYLTTGEAKILGTGRNIVLKTKDDEFIKKKLTVTERIDDNGKRFFSGVFGEEE